MSDVSTNDTIIEGNIADDDYDATKNARKLNLNEDMVITKNTAKRHSAIENANLGIINTSKYINITDNYDKQQLNLPVHNEGVLNMGSS